MMKTLLPAASLAVLLAGPVLAQTTNSGTDKFAQLGTELPTPNAYRTASGAPGTDYWQQRADYNIRVKLDDEKQAITGSEDITYTNLSPDVLTYLWVQLDQNIMDKTSITTATQVGQIQERMPFQALDYLQRSEFDGGFKISEVKLKGGKALPYVVNHTMMRVDLPTPLRPKQAVTFSLAWSYNINDSTLR